MAQLDSDSFTYANGALAAASSAKWTKLSSFNDLQVISNAISGTDLDTFGVITSWPGSTTDQYAQAKATVLGGDGGGPTVRSDAVNNAYFAHVGAVLEVFSCVAAVSTNIGSDGAAAANDTIYLEAQGTQIVVKQNGVTRITVSNSALSSGKPGLYCFSSADVLDDWAAGDFIGGAPAAAAIHYMTPGAGWPRRIDRVRAT
jgi:hypothetical protein